jgi:peptide/nickel transport system substrate-binding protein
MKRWALLAAVLVLGLTVAACGSSSSTGTKTTTAAAAANSGKVGGKLVIGSYLGTTWSCHFNPFNPAENVLSVGFVYEPLEYINILESSNPPKPWLASSSAWSDSDRTLTFTVRSGVKWSDGQPFSANDVAYTFNAMKTSPALDLNAIWAAHGGPLTSVAVKGSDQVVFKFNSAAQTYFYYVAYLTPIIPKHIWGSLDQTKLATYADSNPVGTGPYRMAACQQTNVKYLRNTTYWQSTPGHPVPQIQEVDYPSFLGNNQTNLFLIQGQAQWGAQPIPNIQTTYIAKDPAHRHVWFPPILNVSLVPNLDNPILSKLAVRQAIAMAINRADVSVRGETRYEPPANQTGIIVPTYKQWYQPSLSTLNYDPAKAEQLLQQAGFKKGSDGIYQNAQGQKLSFTIKTVSGYTDWDASLVVIVGDLKAIGIQATVQDENSGPYTTDLQKGNFQLAYAGSGGPYTLPGPTPYYELRGMLFSGNIGSTNYPRYKSASTDALFRDYSATANLSKQIQIVHKIEQVMVTDVPFIPVTEGVVWYTYDNSHIGGWPTEADPYAQPNIYTPLEDTGVILDHLYPLH